MAHWRHNDLKDLMKKIRTLKSKTKRKKRKRSSNGHKEVVMAENS
jgi:hypothetical protein